MGNLFSKKKAPSRVTEHDQAVLQLKSQRDKLRQYQRKIEGRLDRERLVAKQLLKDGKKDRAMLLLKKKRYQEKLIDQAMAQLDNIDKMIHDIEFAQIETEIVEKLRVGNESLKRINRLISLEDVERIMDETRESAELQQEIGSIISGELSDVDMKDVEAEFDALVAAEGTPATPLPRLDDNDTLRLPDVPTDRLPSIPAAAKARKRPEKEMLAA